MNPFALDEDQLLALEAHMPKFQARDAIRDYAMSDRVPSAERVHDLYLAASESKAFAEEQTQAFVKARLRNNGDVD